VRGCLLCQSRRFAIEEEDSASIFLLFIESIPNWKTHVCVATLMRNDWMHQLELGKKANSFCGLAQGIWPSVPVLPGTTAIRRDHNDGLIRSRLKGSILQHLAALIDTEKLVSSLVVF
jgi:hypothetical protein